MRSLLIVGMACVLAAPAAMARAIPNPNQKHAPGNEAVQTPIAQAGYSAAVNYQLQCAGCHLGDGSGSRANDVPRMKDFVGNFLKVEGGREFLVRVPGMAQSALNDEQLAVLINWLMRKEGIAGASLPEQYQPYTGEEVAAVRHRSVLNVPSARSELITQMRAKGIAIEDGMSY